jgi:flagellar hook protein FlgE
MSSLLTGVTGLRVNQQMLDVVGNNLANSNTTGFKDQQVQFGDLVYQTLNPGTASTANSGGTDPTQVGLGAQVLGINSDFSQSTLQQTGQALDMAIQGNGFFVVNDGTQNLFSRAGSFGVDSQNFLVDPATGDRVQRFGSVGEATPTTPGFQTPGNNSIKIPYGTGIPGKGTETVTLQGNLSTTAAGPLAEVLTSSTPFQSGQQPADATTTLNSLDDNASPYPAPNAGTGQLSIQGTDADGTAVSFTMSVDSSTTLGDLVTQINQNYQGATASISNGNLVLQANNAGSSKLSLAITDVAGNTGSTSWSNHNPSVTTVGKDGDTVTGGIQFFDAQGTAHTLSLVFQKVANNQWTLTGSVPASDGTMTDNSVSNITFNNDGSFLQAGGAGLGDAFMTVNINGIATPQKIGFNFGSVNGFDGLTQVGGNSSAAATGQDGYAAGFLSSLSIAQDGTINGIFTNGQTMAIAQLALATFANPNGLDRQGSNYYGLSSQSGPALLGAGQSGGRGSVQQKALETSNVDVSLEFTRLIIAQQGFQINAKTITVSDQVLQALSDIIR